MALEIFADVRLGLKIVDDQMVVLYMSKCW